MCITIPIEKFKIWDWIESTRRSLRHPELYGQFTG
jgi:hypothetical protein